jgi:hypothetical protein
MPPSSGAFKAVETAKVVQIDTEDPAKTVKIGTGLNPKLESELVDFLWRNKDIFTWSPVELLSISQEVTEHTLNIKPCSRLVMQGNWHFIQEKHRAMGEEISRLLATGFSKEI